MDPPSITDKLIEVVNLLQEFDTQLPTPKGLVATSAKYIGRVSNLLPATPRALEIIHTICSPLPYLSEPEGLAKFCELAEKLLPTVPGWILDNTPTIVDLLFLSIALCANLYRRPPYSYSRLKKYLAFLQKDPSFSEFLKSENQGTESKKQFIVPFGTGGRHRVEYVLSTPELVGQIITVKGWAKTARIQGKGAFAFIALTDGSTVKTLQIIVDGNMPNFDRIKGTGISLSCTGNLVNSPGSDQATELQVNDPELHSILLIGDCDQHSYPISKKTHSLEFLRTQAHLRPRTNTIGAIARIRSALAFATHQFFNSRGFLYIHTPIITTSDCEGAGELFEVSFKLTEEEAKERAKEGKTLDFFCRPAFLTCSGQLNVENFACALTDVYTFGPTFRAENSHTSRHLSEF